MCEIIFLILVHSKKAIVDNVSNEFGNDRVSKLVQPRNCIKSRLSTELGITTDFKPVQPAKACQPIEVTELGMVTEVKPVQPSKALPPIDVTELGIVEFMQPAISVLVSVSMMALQLLRESYFVFPLSTTIDVNPVHSIKALSPIEVTKLGIETAVKQLSCQNANSSIAVTEDGMVISCNLGHNENEYPAIVVNELGRFIDVRFLQL